MGWLVQKDSEVNDGSKIMLWWLLHFRSYMFNAYLLQLIVNDWTFFDGYTWGILKTLPITCWKHGIFCKDNRHPPLRPGNSGKHFLVNLEIFVSSLQRVKHLGDRFMLHDVKYTPSIQNQYNMTRNMWPQNPTTSPSSWLEKKEFPFTSCKY